MIHRCPESFLTRPIPVHVVGAGGNGAQVVLGLARLNATLLALGHPGGLEVTIYDDDVVEAHNVGRQPFYEGDVGLAKATVLATRINLCYGWSWAAQVERFRPGRLYGSAIVIGCVDSLESRQSIRATVDGTGAYWLDLGNDSRSGQVLLGRNIGREDFTDAAYLPLPSDLVPGLVDGAEDLETPTCSVAASVARQGVFVNQMAATLALQMLDTLLRTGQIAWHGAFFNLETLRVQRIPVDPKVWTAMGWSMEGRGA